MPSVTTTTSRRLRHADGYLALGLLNEAAAELAVIPREEWALPDVLSARIDLRMAKKEWGMVAGFGEQWARRHPDTENGWIAWAYALRELNRIEEAKTVLLEAEPRHGESGVLHYNLACYHCLLGELAAARARLRQACQLGKEWKKAARQDTDLKAIWDDIRSM